MATMQDLIDRARIPLNDTDKDRYSDAELLAFANTAIERAYSLRPDLRFGAYTTPFADLPLTGTFPLPGKLFQSVADYVTFRAESKDDEHVDSNRAAAFMALFEKELLA